MKTTYDSGVNVHCVSVYAFVEEIILIWKMSFLIYERINGIVRANHIDIVEDARVVGAGIVYSNRM